MHTGCLRSAMQVVVLHVGVQQHGSNKSRESKDEDTYPSRTEPRKRSTNRVMRSPLALAELKASYHVHCNALRVARSLQVCCSTNMAMGFMAKAPFFRCCPHAVFHLAIPGRRCSRGRELCARRHVSGFSPDGRLLRFQFGLELFKPRVKIKMN